jgi:hypothetical protein
MSEIYIGPASVLHVDGIDAGSSPEITIEIDDLDSAAWHGSVSAAPAESFVEGDVIVVLLAGQREGDQAKGRVSVNSPTSLTILGFEPFSRA